jgi:hypothetical protein
VTAIPAAGATVGSTGSDWVAGSPGPEVARSRGREVAGVDALIERAFSANVGRGRSPRPVLPIEHSRGTVPHGARG